LKSNEPVVLTRKQEILKFFIFFFFSVSAALIQVLVYTFLSEVVHLSYWLAYLPSLIASVLWNFTVNRKFTFKSTNDVKTAMLKVAVYYIVFTPVSTWWVDKLDNINIGINVKAWEYIVLIGTMIINFATEFCVYRFWVFKNSINTSEAGKREQDRFQNLSSS